VPLETTRRKTVLRSRLELQELEQVAAPSSIGAPEIPAFADVTAYQEPTRGGGHGGGHGGGGGGGTGQNAAPTVNGTATNLGNGAVRITGSVSDDQAVAGLTVIIIADGVATSATVLANGTYSVTFFRPTTDGFQVSLSVTDALGATGTSTAYVEPE
jgi:hypothetical protein